MEKRYRRIERLLAIAICFSILAFPACLRGNKLLQTKFIPSDLSFENLDQEGGLPDHEKEVKVFRPTVFPQLFLLGAPVFEQSFQSFSHTRSPRQDNLVLRC